MEELLKAWQKAKDKELVNKNFSKKQLKIVEKFVKLREVKAQLEELERMRSYVPRYYYNKRVSVLEETKNVLMGDFRINSLVDIQIRKV